MHADIRQRTASSRPEQENLTTGAVKSRTTALLWISYIDSPITDLPPNATHGGIIYTILLYIMVADLLSRFLVQDDVVNTLYVVAVHSV